MISYYNNEVLPAYNGYVANACSTGVTNPDCWNGVLPPSDPECQPRSTEKCPGVRKAQSDARSALSTIQSLYERCMGNGTTRMKIAGIQQNDLAELELSAPFVPIMAQYRIWDVINARGTVCDIPDNGLYGAEVTVDVSWYDKHGSAAGQSYMTCDHGGTGVGPQNLLRNGSFEEAWGGSPGGTASGAAAPGWTFIWKKNTSDTCNLGDGQNLEYCKAPEFQPIDGIYDQRRVLDGNLASKWFTFANKHDVIAYQVVDNVPSGYNLFGYFQGWRNSDTGDGTFRDESGCVQTEAGYVGDSQAEICVYNGDIRNIVGGEHEIPMGAYDGMMAEIRANGSCAMISNEAFFYEWHSGIVNSGSGQVTVILRASATVPAFNTDDYWDNICLVPTGSAVTKSVEIPPTPPRTGSDDECRFYNPPEQSCELQIGGGSGKKLFSEEMTFYMPGLGVMPYIAERLETGSSKSPDTNIDAPMCKDRRDSDVNHNYNKAYSALDVYIIQNLPNKYAHNFAKFIAPVDYDRDEINLMKNASRVDVGGGVYVRNPGEPAPAGYNRFATTNELLIMQSAKNYGLSKEQTAYVLATAKFESSVQPKEEYGCCDRRYDETRCTSASQDPCGCTAVHQWYGACNPITNQCYYGRGFVQLTHEGNYQRMGNYLNKPLASNPSLALDPNTAAEIIVFGMKAGSFTGRALESSYPGTIEAYIPARSIINGDTYNICSRSDCNGTETVGEHVARIAYSYLNGSVMNTY
jgi:hypothetical protein